MRRGARPVLRATAREWQAQRRTMKEWSCATAMPARVVKSQPLRKNTVGRIDITTEILGVAAGFQPDVEPGSMPGGFSRGLRRHFCAQNGDSGRISSLQVLISTGLQPGVTRAL